MPAAAERNFPAREQGRAGKKLFPGRSRVLGYTRNPVSLMMKLLLIAVLVWCGAVGAPAEEYAFPGEREWISKLGDVVRGSFQSCTGSKLVLKTGRKRVEIPLNRLDEEDAALVNSLTGTAARRDLKLAAMLWPFLMKELEKVTWTTVEKDISPRYNETARKKTGGTLTGNRKIDGLACTTSLSAIKGPPFRIQEYYRPQNRPESARGQKSFDMVLDQGSLSACYDAGTGLLTPSTYMLEERTEMRGPVSSLLPAGEKIAAREAKSYSNTDYSLIMEARPVKGAYETCKPNSLGRKKLAMYWNAEGKMVCGVIKLEYDNLRLAALFDDQRKLVNAPGLGYAVILSRLDKKGRDSKGQDGHYYHVALAADGLPVYHHEGPETEADLDPLHYGKLRDSEKKTALAKEKEREQALRARQQARQRLVESARKRRE